MKDSNNNNENTKKVIYYIKNEIVKWNDDYIPPNLKEIRESDSTNFSSLYRQQNSQSNTILNSIVFKIVAM